MNQQTNLRWGLVLLLAVLGLVRPLSSIAGVYGSQGEDSWAPVLVTGAVSAVWMGVVVAVRAPNPLLTLTAAGGMYGVFGILLQQFIWNLLLGAAPAGTPSSAPVLVISWVSILVTNAVWGAFLGLVAAVIGRLLPRHSVEA